MQKLVANGSYDFAFRGAPMSNGMGRIRIFANTESKPLAGEISRLLSVRIGDARVARFNDPEVDVQILENVRGDDVYVIASTKSPAENIIEAIWLAEAARLSSAGRVTYVIPYCGYARSDRKDAPRKPVGIALALKMLEVAQPDRFIFLDIHAEQSLACVGHAVYDHVYGSFVGIPYLRDLLAGRDFVIAAPDRGGAPRAAHYAKHLGQNDFVFFSKIREEAGKVKKGSAKIVGDVAGKVVVLVDDIIDTGGTMLEDADAAMAAGATAVVVFATHGLFTKDSIARFHKSPIERVIVTDSIYHEPTTLAGKSDKIVVLSVASLLAQAIRRTHDGQSLSELIL